MMVRKNSPKLMAELNAFIAHYPEGSMQRNVLLQKYLKSVKYAKPATSKEDLSRFNQTVDYLRKYSDQYKLDYLLMAAQGYQESGLDHSKKSPVGAIGVMQVMPKTGEELKVGDISRLDANVHAGVKYIRFMFDRYYGNEPMDPLNKGLFTFASYNAGPARIQQLRETRRETRVGPEQVVQQCRDRRGGKHRPGNRAVRLEHLQVLPRLQNAQRAETGACQGEGCLNERSKRPIWRLS